MKKSLMLFVAIAIIFAVTSNVLAGIKMKPKQMDFKEIDSLWQVAPFLKNEAPSKNHLINYSGAEKDASGSIRYFINHIADYEIMMCVIGMPMEMMSQRLSIQLVVNGDQIIIPEEISYQVYDFPKLINGKIIVKASTGMYPDSDYFYTVIDFEENVHRCSYYFTKRLLEVEFEKNKQSN